MTIFEPRSRSPVEFFDALVNRLKPSSKIKSRTSHLSYELLLLQLVLEDVRETGQLEYPAFVDSLSLVKPKIETVSQEEYQRNLLFLLIENVHETGICEYPPLQQWLHGENYISVLLSNLDRAVNDIKEGVDRLRDIMLNPEAHDLFEKIHEPFDRLLKGMHYLDNLLDKVCDYRIDNKGEQKRPLLNKLIHHLKFGRIIAKSKDRMKSLNCLVLGHYTELNLNPTDPKLRRLTLKYLLEVKSNSTQWSSIIRDELQKELNKQNNHFSVKSSSRY